MKELSIEEKAKAYDNIVGKILLFMAHGVDPLITRADVQNFFPELKESEDERIREAVKYCLDKVFTNNTTVFEVTREQCFTWLEKQGEQKSVPDWMPKFLDELRSKKNYFDWDEHKDIEGGILAIIKWMNPNYFNGKDSEQKPIDKTEPKFKVGDWIVCEASPKFTAFKTGDVVQINNKETLKLFLRFEDCFRLWDITKDAKDGDVLAGAEYRFPNIIIYGGYINNYGDRIGNKAILAYCGWNGEKLVINKKKKEGFGGIGYIPATKEQRNLLFQKMKEAGYEWDYEKKELKKIEKKSAEWSEEDETGLTNTIIMLKEGASLHFNKKDIAKAVDWLKSLKDRVLPQPQWSKMDNVRLTSTIEVLEFAHSLDSYNQYGKEDIRNNLSWLKSIRPQSQWKPSEEQIKVCKEVYADMLSAKGFYIGTVNSELNRLEEELKKLREE